MILYGNINGKLHQLLVLIGLARSPAFEFTWTEAERERFAQEMDRAMNGPFTEAEQALRDSTARAVERKLEEIFDMDFENV